MARKSPYTSIQPNESKGIVLSLVLHVGIVAMGYVSIPFMRKDPPEESPIILELVTIDDVTAAPPKPVPQEEPKPEPKNVEIEPVKAADMTPPQVDQMPPPPDLKIQEEPKPPEKKVEPPKPKPEPPKKKKDEWADLQSLVKDLEKKDAKKQEQQAAVSQDKAKVIAPMIADKATMTELDAIRAHIEACWRIDPGKEGIEELSAEIRVLINRDGSVQQAQIVDMGRYFADSAFRTFANSARNAVLSCGNIPFSPQRYDTFKDGIVFNFSPQGRVN
jgi:outer membrane biosynthesis protein TonB